MEDEIQHETATGVVQGLIVGLMLKHFHDS